MNSEVTSRRRNLVVGLLSLVILIILAGLLEGGLRLRHWIKYGTTTNSVFSFTINKATGLRIPTPGSTTSRISINTLGFRSPEIEMPKPKSRIRLAFVGASTTFCAEATRNETTWPHLVWSELQTTYPDIRFDYVNASVPGYGISHSLIDLEYRVKPLAPDVIIIYHGANDLSYDTRQLAVQQGIVIPERDSESWSLTWFLIRKNLQVLVRQFDALRGKNRLVFDPKKLTPNFRQNVTKLVLASQKLAAIAAMATHSHKVRRDQSGDTQLKAANTALYYMPYMTLEGLLNAYDEYNHVIRAVARETNAVMIEAELGIPGDDIHFSDSVHFTDNGSQVMAKVVLETLVQSAQFQALIESKRLSSGAM